MTGSNHWMPWLSPVNYSEYRQKDVRVHLRTWSGYFKYGLLAVFLVGLGVRVLYLNAARSGPLGNPDSPAYEDLAGALKDHGPYSTQYSGGPGGFPADLQRTPGY